MQEVYRLLYQFVLRYYEWPETCITVIRDETSKVAYSQFFWTVKGKVKVPLCAPRGVQTSSRISLYAAFLLIVLDLQNVAMVSVTEFHYYKTFCHRPWGPKKGTISLDGNVKHTSANTQQYSEV
jgi:hypothetical protein